MHDFVIMITGIITLAWIFLSHMLDDRIRKGISIAVGIIGFIFTLVWVRGGMIFVIILEMFFISGFWVVHENRGKKDITFEDIKNSDLYTLLFCLGDLAIFLAVKFYIMR